MGRKQLKKIVDSKTFQFLVQPFLFFSKKKFYYYGLSDLLFLLYMIFLGVAIGPRTETAATSYGSLITTLFLFSLLFLLGYGGAKVLFFSQIKRPISFLNVLWKHCCAFLCFTGVYLFVYLIIFYLIRVIFKVSMVIPINKVVVVIFSFFFYITYLYYHRSIEKPFFRGVLITLRDTYTKMNWRIPYAMVMFFIVALLLFSLLSFVLRTLYYQGYVEMYETEVIFQPIATVISFLLISLTLTVNKLLAYEVEV